MTWFDRHPEDLAEQSEPSEALAALRALDELSESQMVALDVCLNVWVVRVLLRPNDREGILEVQQICELAQELAPQTPEAQRLCVRWEAFSDLLEGKRHALQTLAVEEAPPKLLHEDLILERARQAPHEYRQSELMAELKLSAGRITQILGVLEAQGKIVRQRRGKHSWISLPVAEQMKPALSLVEKAEEPHLGAASVFFGGLKRAA